MATPTHDPLDFAGAQPLAEDLPAPARHPLGLPPGSVRSLLALFVCGLIWALILIAKDKVVEIPLYLCYLLFLIMGSFFAAHGNSIAGTGMKYSPWHLPRGSIRLLLVLGFAAVIGWKTYTLGEFPEFRVDDPREQPYLPIAVLGTYFLGILCNRLVDGLLSRGRGAPAWYQDVLAWVSLLAMLGLAVEVVVHLMINPSMEGVGIDLRKLQTILSAIIGFYFGARS